MPKKRPTDDTRERSKELARAGRTQAAKSVLRAARNKGIASAGETGPTISLEAGLTERDIELKRKYGPFGNVDFGFTLGGDTPPQPKPKRRKKG